MCKILFFTPQIQFFSHSFQDSCLPGDWKVVDYCLYQTFFILNQLIILLKLILGSSINYIIYSLNGLTPLGKVAFFSHKFQTDRITAHCYIKRVFHKYTIKNINAKPNIRTSLFFNTNRVTSLHNKATNKCFHI